MGTGEEAAAPKPSKPAASTQEVPTQPAYPDWSQAYYGAGGTPPFFASTVASPTPHPYLWGGQHPMMPPYGTPVPYPHMYPPGGVYAHPSMTTAPGSAQTTPGLEKGSNGKEGASSKKNKGVSGNGSSVGSKGGDGVKATSGSGNDASSHSGESGSEGSSDANEDNQQEFGTRKPGGSGPGTNLNMGMDLWNASTSGASKRPNSAVPGAMMSDQWVQQDERELKRQRRKQSNRESARRSRLRKQAECEELQVRVESLTNENSSLKEELQRLSEECDKLTSDNTSIKEELTRICGTDAVAALERNGSATRPRDNGEADS